MNDETYQIWSPTNELRWACQGVHGIKMLEQKWVNQRFTEEWRAVEFVDVSVNDPPPNTDT